MRDEAAKVKRLSIWFCLNLVIFITCYLNYRFQLKHRYLYKILNVGLCFSRAAAMVINFNLLLVWLPMCKYSLTRLACLATGQLRHLKQERQLQVANYHQQLDKGSNEHQQIKFGETSKVRRLVKKFKTALDLTCWRMRFWLVQSKISTINSFLISVDHCTSLHTICATTITIASITHTLAHLMNVINFSKNFDPLLNNLNMAEYKGQNPLQLLVSVPGITGSLMIIILILMSLSSVDIIRNSSYDSFRIFHRLSVFFVILLFLHPFSHVLKEQSNVERHHPELCYDKMAVATNRILSTNNNSQFLFIPTNTTNNHLSQVVAATTTLPASFSSKFSIRNRRSSQYENLDHQGRDKRHSSTTRLEQQDSQRSVNKTSAIETTSDLNDFRDNSSQQRQIIAKVRQPSGALVTTNEAAATTASVVAIVGNTTTIRGRQPQATYHQQPNYLDIQEQRQQQARNDSFCLDSQPLFVAQSSICWYVLSAGLSCYILDLLLRKLRRTKSPIQLLAVRSDSEGNLIELILSNNHKRFSHWLPGQFVYLNCPQIATFEWHPFTISSMDNSSRQFTLHIKTGGDWTRKLRKKLEQRHNSMSLLSHQTSNSTTNSAQCLIEIDHHKHNLAFAGSIMQSNFHLDTPILPNFDCYSKKGELQIECTKVSRCAPLGEFNNEQYEKSHLCSADIITNQNQQQQLQQVYSVCGAPISGLSRSNLPDEQQLNLFVDGPFHSPFERLLEQQVSVCIASGVGWTAFSSVFQCITNNFSSNSLSNTFVSEDPKDWWSRWRKFYIINKIPTANNIQKLSDTKLHLMVIVTSIEQLKPFYYLALNYFKRIKSECQIGADSHLSPVKAITAFITRSTIEDGSIGEFCQSESIVRDYVEQQIKVNEVFTIHFGKPDFDIYLRSFSKMTTTESSSEKISVYCCGNYLVKKTVQEVCHNLNKTYKSNNHDCRPFYSYHEESF